RTLVARIDVATVRVGPNHQGEFAVARRDILRGGRQSIDEPRAGSRNVEGLRIEAELVLHDAGSRRADVVGRERADHDEVDLVGVDSAVANGALGRLDTHVAGGVFGGQMPAFFNAGALLDPTGFEIVSPFEIFVRDDRFRRVRAGRNNLHAQ